MFLQHSSQTRKLEPYSYEVDRILYITLAHAQVDPWLTKSDTACLPAHDKPVVEVPKTGHGYYETSRTNLCTFDADTAHYLAQSQEWIYVIFDYLPLSQLSKRAQHPTSK